ncbi:fimbrillin family protein [Bacteroides fragilis]
MKKKFLFIAVAALVMAACSKDEQTAVNRGAAIDFRGAMATRATETVTANLNDIFVTALDKNNANFFINEQFTKDVDNFFKSSPNSYYWPNDDSELKFFAYAPSSSDLDGTLTIDNLTKTLADFSPKTTIADQKDFVSCKATGKKSVNESAGVALTFKHQLSQIEIKAKNDQDAYRYKVVAVRIGQPVSKGTFDTGTENWNLEMDKVNYTVPDFGEITLNGTPESLMGTGGSAMLIPQQLTAWDAAGDKPNANKGAYLAVKLQITTKAGARVYPAEVVGDYDWLPCLSTRIGRPARNTFTHSISQAVPARLIPKNRILLTRPIRSSLAMTSWEITPSSLRFR